MGHAENLSEIMVGNPKVSAVSDLQIAAYGESVRLQYYASPQACPLYPLFCTAGGRAEALILLNFQRFPALAFVLASPRGFEPLLPP